VGAEVATVNSSLELTVGSSSKEKPAVTRAVTVALSKSKLVTATQEHHSTDLVDPEGREALQ
jgi:hypothetical protein